MNQLVEKLNEIFDKYEVNEVDIMAVQELLADIEGANADEFTYEEPEEE